MKDSKIENLIKTEKQYEQNTLDLIPSENYPSTDVREACGSILTNKYSEGYPHARYYGGQGSIDNIEIEAQKRALKIFGLKDDDWHVNVQPYSGSSANAEIYFAMLKFGDKVLGMRLDHGGHITHGLPISFSGKAYKFISYRVNSKSELLDYNEIEKIAIKEKPKMIICGATAYSRTIDFERFGKIAKKVGAYFLADISHIAGLIVAKIHPSPFPYADFVMTTTHKTLRGPRGAIIICKKEYSKLIDRAVFPGMQGGPHDHITAAKAVCFLESLQPEFKKYCEQVVKNAKVLASAMQKKGFRIVSGGTDNHMMLIDLRPQKMTGKEAQELLEKVGIIVNKNTIPNDVQKPFVGSGIRIGTPALTTRGMKEKEMIEIADLIMSTLLKKNPENIIKKNVLALCKKFPIK